MKLKNVAATVAHTSLKYKGLKLNQTLVSHDHRKNLEWGATASHIGNSNFDSPKTPAQYFGQRQFSEQQILRKVVKKRQNFPQP